MNNNQINPVPSDNINRRRLAEITQEAKNALHNTLANPVSSNDVYEGQLGALPHSHPLSNQSYDLSKLGGITYNPDINIEDQLAGQQGITESILKGLIGRFTTKTLGTAASSLATLFNIPEAIIKGFSAEDGRGFSTFLDTLYNGGAVGTIRELQESAEKKLEVYRSEAEQKASLWSTEHIFSKKMFEELGDLFGFSTGAYLSGMAGSSIFGNGFIGGFLSTLSSTLGESGIEAYHATDENLKDRYALLDNNREQEAAKIDLSDLSPEDKLKAYGELNTKYSKLKAEAYNLSKDVGNMTFLANMAILGISNQIAFGKSWFQGKVNKAFSNLNKQLAKLDDDFAKGLIDEATYKANKKLLISDRELLSRSLTNSIGDNIRLSGHPLSEVNPLRASSELTKAKLYTGLAAGRLREGVEEMSQSWVSNASKDYYNDILGSLEQTNFSSRGEEGFLKAVNTYLNRGIQTLGDSSAWYEFAMGTLLGTTGTVAIQQNKDGKYRLAMAGNVVTEHKEAIEHYNKVQEIVDTANKYFEKPEFQKKIKYALSRYNRENEKNEALKSGDVNKYKALEEAGVAEDISLFSQIGKIKELKDFYKGRQNLSDKEIEELITATTVTDENGKSSGRYVNADGSIMSIDEVKEDIKNSTEDILNAIDTYTTKRDELSKFILPLSDETISHLAILESSRVYNLNLKQRKLNKLIESLNLDNKHSITDLLDKYEQFLKDELNLYGSSDDSIDRALKTLIRNRTILEEIFNDLKSDNENWTLDTLTKRIEEYNNKVIEEHTNNSGELDPAYQDKLIDLDGTVSYILQAKSFGESSGTIQKLNSKIQALNNNAQNAVINGEDALADSIYEDINRLIEEKEKAIQSYFIEHDDIIRNIELSRSISRIMNDLRVADIKLQQEKLASQQSQQANNNRQQQQAQTDKWKAINNLISNYEKYFLELKHLNNTDKLEYHNNAINGYFGDRVKDAYLNYIKNLIVIRQYHSYITNSSNLTDIQMKELFKYFATIEDYDKLLNLTDPIQLDSFKNDKDLLDDIIKLLQSKKDDTSKKVESLMKSPTSMNPYDVLGISQTTGLTGNTPVPTVNLSQLLGNGHINTNSSTDGPKSMEEYLKELAIHNKNVWDSLMNSSKTGEVWEQAIPQYGLSEIIVGTRNEMPFADTFIPFPQSKNYSSGTNAGYLKVWNYLQNKGAFDYVNQGNITTNTEVVFGIDPTADLDPQYKDSTIFMFAKTKHGLQVIGVLFENNIIPRVGLSEFRVSLLKSYEEYKTNNPQNDSIWIFEDSNGKAISTKPAFISGGQVKYNFGTERPLHEVENLEEAIRNKQVFFSVVKGGQPILPKGINRHEVLIPNNISRMEGTSIMYIKGANGLYIPTPIHTSPIKPTDHETVKALKGILTNFKNAKSTKDRNKQAQFLKNGFFYINSDEFSIELGNQSGDIGIKFKGESSFTYGTIKKIAGLLISKNYPIQFNARIIENQFKDAKNTLNYIRSRGESFHTNVVDSYVGNGTFALNRLNDKFEMVNSNTGNNTNSSTANSSLTRSNLSGQIKEFHTNGIFIYDTITYKLYTEDPTSNELTEITGNDKINILDKLFALEAYKAMPDHQREAITYGNTYFISSRNYNGKLEYIVRNKFTGEIINDPIFTNLLVDQLGINRVNLTNGNGSNAYTIKTSKVNYMAMRSSALLSGTPRHFLFDAGPNNTVKNPSLEAGSIIDTIFRVVIERGYSNITANDVNLGNLDNNISNTAKEELINKIKEIIKNWESEGWIPLANNVVMSLNIGLNLNGDNINPISGIAGESDIVLYNPTTKKYKIVDVKTSRSMYSNPSDLSKFNLTDGYNNKYNAQLYLYKVLLAQNYGIPLNNIEFGEILPVHLSYNTSNNNSELGQILSAIPIRNISASETINNTTREEIGKQYLKYKLEMFGLTLDGNGNIVPMKMGTQTTNVQPVNVGTQPTNMPPNPGASTNNTAQNRWHAASQAVVSRFGSPTNNNGQGTTNPQAPVSPSTATQQGTQVPTTSTTPQSTTTTQQSQNGVNPWVSAGMNTSARYKGNTGTNTRQPSSPSGTPMMNSHIVSPTIPVSSNSSNSTGGSSSTSTAPQVNNQQPSAAQQSPVGSTQQGVAQPTIPVNTPSQSNTSTNNGNRTPNNRRSIKTKGIVQNRIIDDITRPKADLNQELEWLNRALPQLSKSNRVQIVNDLIMVSKKGVSAWGQFKNGIIVISNQAAEGTVYHEAFHYVFSTILNTEERNILLQELRDTNKYEGYDHLQLEEVLAEQFREYVMYREANLNNQSITYKISQFFRRLFNLVFNFNKIGVYADSIFRNIYEGGYASNEVIPPFIEATKVLEESDIEYITSIMSLESFRLLPRNIQDNMLMCR